MTPGSLATLCVAAVIAYDTVALFTALWKRLRGHGSEWRDAIPELCWLGIASAALVTWPAGLNLRQHPIKALLLVGLVAALPVLWCERRWSPERARPIAHRYYVTLVAFGCALGCVIALRYLIFMRPSIEGVDFFYFVCFARDLAAGFTDVPLGRYLYFPGVYAFWRAGIVLGGGTLPSLQWLFLGLLVANAALVGLIVARIAAAASAGVFAGLWYLVMCSRFEGSCGTTEPLASLPVLLGIALWGGRPLRGRSGFLRTIGLGVGLGFGVYAKQQAGLLAFGAASLVAIHRSGPRSERHRLLFLILLPIVAGAVLLIAILGDGQGLEPLRIGLSEIRNYEPRGSLLENLRGVSGRGPLLLGASSVAVSMWVGILLVRPWRPLLADPCVRLLGFCVLSSAAALLPFASRPYLHYALLPLPFLVISVLCGVVILRRLVPETERSRPLVGLLTCLVGIASLTAVTPRSPYLHVWPIEQPFRDPHSVSWRTLPVVADDLTSLRTHVQPGEDLFVLPPRRNEIHFTLQTRSVSFPLGYGWYKPIPLGDLLGAPGLNGVITIQPSVWDSTDLAVCDLFNCGGAGLLLEQHGFQPVTTLRSMTLWRRPTTPER